MTWNDYLSQTQDYPPRPLLVESLPYVKNRKSGLDLGCGAMNDTRLLVASGFDRVDAVDSNPSVQKIAETLPEYGSRLTFYNKTFKEFGYPVITYDIVNAQYALPFIAPEDFGSIWQKVSKALVSEGIFNGQLFGDQDDWAKGAHPEMTFMTREQTLALFSEAEWELIKFQEEKAQRKTASGDDKFWHVFHFIAKKK